MKVLFCHGLESGPHGSKYRALKDAGLDVYSPDCRGMNLAQRIEAISVLLVEDMIVVGSSYGGIAAVRAAMNTPVRLRGMVLCAPALERRESPNERPGELFVSAPVVIVHGAHDDVVPISVSRRFLMRMWRRSPQVEVRLAEVNDGHRLRESHETIVREVQRFAQSSSS